MACRKYLVSGRVQGVFFRASTRARAVEIGLRGFARNLPDGSVEILACGSRENLDELEIWLRHGPPLAKVTQVSVSKAPLSDIPDGFEIY